MNSKDRKRALFAAVAAAAVLAAPSAFAADDWQKQYGERCGQVFDAHQTAELGLLHQCAGTWYQMRDHAKVKDAEKTKVVAAAERLYQEGNKGQAHIARLVLGKCGVAPPTKKAVARKAAPGADKPEKVAEPKRPKRDVYDPPEVSDGKIKKAKKIRKKGFKDYRKERYKAAIKKFEKALSINPRYAQALYDLACTHSLVGDSEEAVEYLWKLRDLGTKKSLRRVQKARLDTDFRDMRDDPAFRDVTGYVRVKITNGVGEYGEDEVERIKKTLEKLHHHVAEISPDKKPRKRPVIWYKRTPEAKAAAYVFDKVLNHPKTKFNIIDWDSESDVIISWGDVIKKDDHGDPIVRSYAPSDPEDAERKADDLLAEQDRALREPEKTARKVDHAIETPERMERRVEGSVRRTESTIKKIGDTGKKIEGIFK